MNDRTKALVLLAIVILLCALFFFVGRGSSVMPEVAAATETCNKFWQDKIKDCICNLNYG